MTNGIFGTDAALGRHYFAPIRGLDHLGRRSQGVALGFCIFTPFRGSEESRIARLGGFCISPPRGAWFPRRCPGSCVSHAFRGSERTAPQTAQRVSAFTAIES